MVNCYVILTDLTKVLLSFVWLKFSSFGWDHDGWRNKEKQEPKLGDSLWNPKIIFKDEQATKLGPLSSNDHRYFTWSYIFIRRISWVLFGASCMIWVFSCFIFLFLVMNPCWTHLFERAKIMLWLVRISLYASLKSLWAMELL